MAAKKKQYRVTNRLITWQVAGKEVTAEDGEVRDDIPEDVVKHFLHIGAVRAMAKGEVIKGEVKADA